MSPCPDCGGLNGDHGLVHVRHGNGGGHNQPCPRELVTEAVRDSRGTIRALRYRTHDQTLVGWVDLLGDGRARAYVLPPGPTPVDGKPLSQSPFRDREAAESALREYMNAQRSL